MYDGAHHVRLAAPQAWPDRLAPVIAAAGMVVDPAATVGVALSIGRTPNDDVASVLDRWLVDSTPHLLVAVHAHGIEVGPWVLPGVSPCIHCVAASTLSGPADDTPALAPALWSMAAGWIARDLAAWRRGETPSTWAQSWLVGAEPVPAVRRWLRHPHCGCTWFDL